MLAMKLGWLVLEGLLWWCFVRFGSVGILGLALLLVLIPLGTIPVSLIQKRRLTITLDAAAMHRKGEEEAVFIKLENPTILPIARVRVDVTVENQLNREILNHQVYIWVMPRSAKECRLNLKSDYCGRLRLGVSQVVLYDSFGMVGIRCSQEVFIHTTVQPESFESRIMLLPNPGITDESESYSQERPGEDLTETFQIRDYVPGDSPRAIHWKLSGKFDKVIVRDAGYPISENVLVFWERTGESGNPEKIDAQAEVVISLCRSLVDSGIQFQVGWNDTAGKRCVLHRIWDMDDFVGIIPRLLRATGTKEGVSGAGLLLRDRPDALCAHMVYIAEEVQGEAMDLCRYGHVTMLLCGEEGPADAVRFDETDYIRQLAEIMI